MQFSDGKETQPSNPDNPKARTPRRAQRSQGIPISTISFGTPNGYVEMQGQRQPVPVDDQTMKKVAQLSGGKAYNASSVAALKNVYANLREQLAQVCLSSRGCAVRRCDSNGGERPTSLILSQQDGGAEGSLSRVVPGRAGAALTKPGRASTARWLGFGERDGEEYARNRRVTVP